MSRITVVLLCFMLLFSVVGFTLDKPYPLSDTKAGSTLLIADFDSWEDMNNIGGLFSGWSKDPTDESQGCRVEISDTEKEGETGHSVRLIYDVDSPKAAYNGMWMELMNMDWSNYKYLVLSVKGDKEAGFTPRFKIELKTKRDEKGRYILTGVTDQWKQFAIPLTSFRGLTKFKDMSIMTIVFDDMRCEPKIGALFIDNIYLSK